MFVAPTGFAQILGVRVAHFGRLQRQDFHICEQGAFFGAQLGAFGIQRSYGIYVGGVLSLQLQVLSV